MKFDKAYILAEKIILKLSPYCHKIAITGDLRRKKEDVNEIELLCLFKTKDFFQLTKKIEEINWIRVKGKIGITKTKFSHFEGIDITLIPSSKEIWALDLLKTTGPESFYKFLIKKIKSNGFEIDGKRVYRKNERVKIEKEEDLFHIAGTEWVPPEKRR